MKSSRAEPARRRGFLWRRRSRPEQAAANDTVRPAAISPVDLGDEAVAGLFSRPGRMSLTILGTAIGLTALVATLGLTRTANERVIGRFDEVVATEILVTARPAGENTLPNTLPWDAAERLERLNGVVAAGNVSTIDIGDARQHLAGQRPSTPNRFQARYPGRFAPALRSGSGRPPHRATLRRGALPARRPRGRLGPERGGPARHHRCRAAPRHQYRRRGLSRHRHPRRRRPPARPARCRHHPRGHRSALVRPCEPGAGGGPKPASEPRGSSPTRFPSLSRPASRKGLRSRSHPSKEAFVRPSE